MTKQVSSSRTPGEHRLVGVAILLFHTVSSTKFVRLGHFCLKPVSSLIIEHFLWECSLFFFENQEAVSLSQAAAEPSAWTYPWYLNNKGGLSMQSFHIYLDLYNGSGIIDSIVISEGGMSSVGGTRKGTYTTRVQSNGTWKIRSVVVETKTYTPDQFFNTLGGRFAYGETEPTGSSGKSNGVGNYYHSLGFWFKTT